MLVLAGCATPSGGPRPGSPDLDAPHPRFDARDVRQLAVFIRVEVNRAALSERAAAPIPTDYEGALLDGLDTRALIAREVMTVPTRDRLDARIASARARDVGADHALLVDVAVARTEATFCRETRTAFRAATLTVSQRATVVRAGDGLVRWQPHTPVAVPSLEPDCETPRASRVRSMRETVQAAVERLLDALLAGEGRR
jgi:hypothetical protein